MLMAKFYRILRFQKRYITFLKKILKITSKMVVVVWLLIPMTIPCFWSVPTKVSFTSAQQNTVPDFCKLTRLIIRRFTTLLGIHMFLPFSWLVLLNGWSRFGITTQRKTLDTLEISDNSGDSQRFPRIFQDICKFPGF